MCAGAAAFAAVIVFEGQIVGEGWNKVTSTNDPTAHARSARFATPASDLGTFSLEGRCGRTRHANRAPMCLAAIYLVAISRHVLRELHGRCAGIGFDDREIYHQIARPADHRDIPTERMLGAEALEVFREWEAKDDEITY